MKSKDSKKRKSGFNPNCSNYLTADGKYYCYEYWDPKAKRVVTQKLEVGKDLSFEPAILLDASDHDMDLIDRYENELRDPLVDAKSNTYKADPNDENALNPWDTLADKSGSPEYACSARETELWTLESNLTKLETLTLQSKSESEKQKKQPAILQS